MKDHRMSSKRVSQKGQSRGIQSALLAITRRVLALSGLEGASCQTLGDVGGSF